MKKLFFWVFGVFVFGTCSYAQNFNYRIALKPLQIDEVPGLQSFAFGQWDGKWLIVGGRLDGLHRRQPWATFTADGNNNQIIVIDPERKSTWTAPLSSLPAAISEQLSSTNMEFYQEGDFLFCIGGYGYSNTASDHITYPNLTVIDVPQVIDAVINDKPYSPFFEQIKDDQFQVCGGKLKTIQDTFYLLGGQKFMGRYNPMGPDHGPGFSQEYTNQVRRFTLNKDAGSWSVKHHAAYTDSAELHRRDYNAEAQILPSGTQAITMYSGVFKQDLDLPYLTAVHVNSSGYQVQNDFRQYYNHYHCAAIPLYSTRNQDMHTLFFGGIAQYYDNEGVLTQDDNVPFVNTIARVTREKNGAMSEYKMNTTMPALMGAGSEFIINPEVSVFSNGVIKLDDLQGDSILLGFVYGGIVSDAPNIFFTNTGTQSAATNRIFQVFVINENVSTEESLNQHSNSSLNVRMYPNPSSGRVILQSNDLLPDELKIKVLDSKGVLVFAGTMRNTSKITEIPLDLTRGVYTVNIESGKHSLTQKLIIH